MEKNKIHKQININKEEEIQTNVIEYNIEKQSVKRRNSSKNKDTLIQIYEFEKLQYWFSEVVKHTVSHYEDYGKNKNELCEHIFKFVDLNKTIKYYKIYNDKYNNINYENIKKFCNDYKDSELIHGIRTSENIYRFH
jgi:hypothetical protein